MSHFRFPHIPHIHPGRLSLLWAVVSWLVGCSAVTTQCIGCKKQGTSSTPQVVFTTNTGKTLAVPVELACTSSERARGLMYRESLKPNHGMLFVFPVASIQSFWMKNTYIPLDMIHINSKNKVVGVVENAKPHTTTSRSIGKSAIYVLEVNAFFARKNGIKPGHTVKIIGARCGF